MQEALEDRTKKRAANSKKKREAAEHRKNEGNKLFRQQDYNGALRCYLDAIQLYRPKPVYQSNIVATYLKLERYQEAEDTATQILYVHPRMLKVRFRRGLARKGLRFFSGATVDFETVLRQDPNCTEAQQELEIISELSDESCVSDTPSTDIDWPHLDNDSGDEVATASDSSDYNHDGNGKPCYNYNHGGCVQGTRCPYLHGPNGNSVRDNLGRNVCTLYILGICKFSDNCCPYLHSKEHLPQQGWHNKDNAVKKIREQVEERMRFEQLLHQR